MKNSIFLSLIFCLGMVFVPCLKSMDDNEIYAMQEAGSNIDGVAKFAAKKTWDYVKSSPKVAGTVLVAAAMPFIIKKAVSPSGFFVNNAPMVGCMVQSGYDLTVGLAGDIANFCSGIKDLCILNLELTVNLERQKKLNSSIIPVVAPAVANEMLSEFEMYNRRSMQSELAILRTREKAILKEIKEAKNKASVSQIGYRILRGSLAGLAGYQLLKK